MKGIRAETLMPGMSGLQLATLLRQSHSELPILLASGYSSKQFIPINERRFPILRTPYKLVSLAAGINQLIKV